MAPARCALLAATLLACHAMPVLAGDRVFLEIWETVNERFLDPDFNGVDWEVMREHYAPLAAEAEDAGERARLINEMLGKLNTSHTRFYTPAEPAYYQLLGIFLPRNPAMAEDLAEKRPGTGSEYVGIGMVTEVDGAGRTFVRDLFHGHPAAEAGIRVGDEILAVDGSPFQPVASFTGKADQAVTVSLRREAAGPAIAIEVTPRRLDGATMFVDAMRASVTVHERDGARVGYVRPWSWAGSQYQAELEGALFWGPLREADALVIDARGGWGGASPSYLNVFTERSVAWRSIQRDGATMDYPSAWTRPVVLLVDGRSRSGKELVAYAFRKFGLGPIVGERTAGAVVAGMPVVLGDGTLLYVSVSDAAIDGVRLEGVGVAPDIEVPWDRRYAAGKDPQRETALEAAVREVAKRKET